MDIVELRKEWVPFFESIKNDPTFKEFLGNACRDTGRSLTYNHFMDSNPRIAWIQMGETRLVMGTHEGVVFKLPFRIAHYERLVKTDGWDDYCKMEVRHYRAAKKAGLDSLFTECDRLCWLFVDGEYYPVYVMKYVEADGEANLSSMVEWFDENVKEPNDDDDDNSLYENYQNDYSEVNSGSTEGVAIYLKGMLGDELYEEFDEFCFKNDITDLHNENFGFDCGRPVMIDYAGFGNTFDGLPTNWFSEFGL